MQKIFAWWFITLLAVGSIAGYLFLSKEIIAGNIKIAEGRKQLAEGQQMLARGKSKLASGERQLSQAKKSYKHFKSLPYFFAPVLPLAGGVAAVAGDKWVGKKISEGNQLVAAGNKKVMTGEAQLAEGELQLQRGIDRLRLANKIHLGCGLTAIILTFLSIFLGFYWRKSVFRFSFPKK